MDPLKSVFPDIARRLTIASYSSSQEPGDKFLFNLDLQGGAIVGFGLTQSTIGGGGGCGAADAYLRPALDRSNIDLLMGAQVTRLIQKNDTSGVPAFKTVKFAQRANGTRYTLTATKEVILSAGALNTPQILLLSGIGDTDDLEDMGITPTMDLPDVGKNLYDHPQLSNYFVVNSTTTLDEISRDSALAAEYLEEWEVYRQGPYTATSSHALGFVRLAQNDSIFELYADPSSGTKSAHYEMVFAVRVSVSKDIIKWKRSLRSEWIFGFFAVYGVLLDREHCCTQSRFQWHSHTRLYRPF